MSTVTKPVMLDETGVRIAEALEGIAAGKAAPRVVTLNGTALTSGAAVIDAVGVPVFVGADALDQYAAYGLTETGWYIFARINAPEGVAVSGATTVEGAAAIIEAGADHVDVAVKFEVASVIREVEVGWDAETVEKFLFRANDLAIRNLDYRTTFYVYDITPFVTWEYALTTDTAFVGTKYYTEENGVYTPAPVVANAPVPADTYYIPGYVLTTDTEFVDGKTYYTKSGDTYTAATVTAGEAVTENTYYESSYVLTTDTRFVGSAYFVSDGEGGYTAAAVIGGETIPAETYYKHSKLIFEGMSRNVTYVLPEVVDCPQEYRLPEIEDDGHGAWYEIRLRHSGSFSSTLVVPEGVKVATEHTQAETAGMNMVDLHYMSIDGVKLWRFMNTHSSLPTT